MSILDLLNKRPYYNVPPCPACGSDVTGRYIRETYPYSTKIIEDGLIHGEIIKISPGYHKDRCFCLVCEHEWTEHVPLTFITKEEQAEEIKKRHIRELIEELKAANPEPEQKKKFFGLF